MEAYWALGETLFIWESYGPAQDALRARDYPLRLSQHTTLMLFSTARSGVTCLVFEAWALWFLGYPDQALKRVT